MHIKISLLRYKEKDVNYDETNCSGMDLWMISDMLIKLYAVVLLVISLFAVSILIPDSARFCNFCRKIDTLWGKFYKLTQVYYCTIMRLKFKSINLMMSDGI